LKADVIDIGGRPIIGAIPVSYSFDKPTENTEDTSLNVRQLLEQTTTWTPHEVQAGQGDPTSCHLLGSFEVHQIAGSITITTLGRSFPQKTINMSHEILSLSFGFHFPGITQPLDHYMQISIHGLEIYQYFIAVIPTIYVDRKGKILFTNQYTFTRSIHKIQEGDEQSLPKLILKYDVEPLVVRISEKTVPFSKFIIRISGIIGGMFVCTGLVHHLTSKLLSSFKALKSLQM
jgi:hypothetical protein